MKYSELELKRMIKAGDLSIEDQIKFNILNFIRTIHLNKQDFIQESYGTEFYGELTMTFRKKAGEVMGLISVKIEDDERTYVFNDCGYELLDDLLQLKKL
jgi:site-specific DNA-adenine methylase